MRMRRTFVLACACLFAALVAQRPFHRQETSRKTAARVHENLEASSNVNGQRCSFHGNATRRIDVIAFTHDGDVKEWQLVSLTVARYFNPGACVLVLTNNAALRSHDVILKLNVHVELIALDDPRVTALAQNYKHSSSNSEYFELHCLSRFVYLDNFVSTLPETWRMDIWHLDLDVVLFSTLRQPFAQIHVWALTPTSSYFARFSQSNQSTTPGNVRFTDSHQNCSIQCFKFKATDIDCDPHCGTTHKFSPTIRIIIASRLRRRSSRRSHSCG